MSYRCPLARLLPSGPDVEKIKHDGWHQHQALFVMLDDARLDMIDREFIRRIGDRLYGKENGGKSDY